MSYLTKRKTLELLFVAIVFVGSILFLTVAPAPKGKAYDCGMAEWHPDIPNSVKEECRALRTKNFQEDLKKPK